MARRSIENVCNFSISSRECTNIWQDLEWDDHPPNSALKCSSIFPVSGPPRSTASPRDLHALLCKVARSRLTTYFVGKPNLEIEGRISIEEEDHKVYGWEDGPCPVVHFHNGPLSKTHATTHSAYMWPVLWASKAPLKYCECLSQSPSNTFSSSCAGISCSLLHCNGLVTRRNVGSTLGCTKHTWYLSFFLHGQNFWRIKFTPKNANFSR